MRRPGPGSTRRCCAPGRSPATRALCRRFEEARRRVLCGAVRRDTLRADVVEMRRACAASCRSAGPGQFDIKQDAGGIADIEFLVQYWCWRRRASTRNREIQRQHPPARGAGAASGVLDGDRALWLKESLHRLSYTSCTTSRSREGARGGRGRHARRALACKRSGVKSLSET